MIKLTFFYFLFFILFVFVFGGCSLLSESLKIEEINIGVILPFSDENTIFGVEVRNVLDLSIEEINGEGGINGKIVNLVYRDGDCDYETSKFAMEEFVEEGFEFVIGGVCSDETLGAGLVAENNGILLISPSSISSRITDLGDFIFRTVPPTKKLSVKLANEIYDDNYRKLSIINEISSYTESLKEDLIIEFESLGGEVVYDNSFNMDFNNFSNIFLNISTSMVDSFVFIFQNPNFEKKFISQLVKSNLNLPMYGDLILITDGVYKIGGDYLEGVKVITPIIDEDKSIYKKFILSFENRYNYSPDKVPHFYYSAAYDLPFILKMAMENCLKLDAVCVKDNLYGIEYYGVSGNLSFDAYGDPKFDLGVFEIIGGGLVLIE